VAAVKRVYTSQPRHVYVTMDSPYVPENACFTAITSADFVDDRSTFEYGYLRDMEWVPIYTEDRASTKRIRTGDHVPPGTLVWMKDIGRACDVLVQAGTRVCAGEALKACCTTMYSKTNERLNVDIQYVEEADGDEGVVTPVTYYVAYDSANLLILGESRMQNNVKVIPDEQNSELTGCVGMKKPGENGNRITWYKIPPGTYLRVNPERVGAPKEGAVYKLKEPFGGEEIHFSLERLFLLVTQSEVAVPQSETIVHIVKERVDTKETTLPADVSKHLHWVIPVGIAVDGISLPLTQASVCVSGIACVLTDSLPLEHAFLNDAHVVDRDKYRWLERCITIAPMHGQGRLGRVLDAVTKLWVNDVVLARYHASTEALPDKPTPESGASRVCIEGFGTIIRCDGDVGRTKENKTRAWSRVSIDACERDWRPFVSRDGAKGLTEHVKEPIARSAVPPTEYSGAYDNFVALGEKIARRLPFTARTLPPTAKTVNAHLRTEYDTHSLNAGSSAKDQKLFDDLVLEYIGWDVREAAITANVDNPVQKQYNGAFSVFCDLKIRNVGVRAYLGP